MNTKKLTFIGLMTAVTCILAPMSVPIGVVPISLTNLVIYFGLYLLGTKMETLSYVIYLLIGLVGVPVFSGFTGGVQKLLGPTGGYLLGFLPMAVIAGIFIEKFHYKVAMSLVGMILGMLVCYLAGTAWLAFSAKIPFAVALMKGVVPFVAGDLIKMVVVALLGPQIKKRLTKVFGSY